MDFFSNINFYVIFQILYVLTAIGVVIVVISENRNPLKTISWVMILLLLPLVGLIIYYFFGEDNRKKRLISRKMQKKLNRKALERIDMQEILNPPAQYKGLITLLNNLKDTPIYGGNKISFFSSGQEKFDVLFSEIEKAQSHIHIQYYIYMDDEIGTRLKDLLIKKASEGVEVRLLYDDVGSWKVKNKFFKEMESNGIEVTPFLKVAFPLLTSRVNYRNHRKVVVIDGKTGFMGGMNVADRYVQGINGGVWRDSHFLLEGKAVYALQISFVTDWYSVTKEFISSRKYFPTLSQEGNVLMQIATSGPTGEFKEIHQGIFYAITNAKKYIYIQTPYFIPTDSLLLAIQTAAISGVEVRLMIPKESDTTFVHIASLSYIKQLLSAGVKVYFYTAGFLHSKLMVIDDSLVITGSANMDVRSFEHNFEIDAFIYNNNTASEARSIFEKDMEDSHLVNYEEWISRPWFNRFKESFFRLFTPLL
ncbi:cardiolipin synthase [Dysgonomonas sp. 216]|uniref:cardiolipin synthase n=1 Tax=Dysgonomonas sp. 216 TaxID=2302934 RepID=UPI0013D15086|nr:cardiolipin synthase [Dysgonomonas sp. 216]NDW18241.1 cardiolipin synthase [Dysgonomonas sp. 216]